MVAPGDGVVLAVVARICAVLVHGGGGETERSPEDGGDVDHGRRRLFTRVRSLLALIDGRWR